MSPPKYKTLRAFLDAHERGEIPTGARLRYRTMDSAVIIETRRGRVLYLCGNELTFLTLFATEFDLETLIG